MAAPSRSAGGASRGKWIAAALATAVHVAFILVLVFTVNWQNPKPEAVTAELYAPPSAAAKAEPPAKTEPPPEPPKAEPEPPKRPPEPVLRPPEPPKKIEPVKPPPKAAGPTKAEIALKEKQELERKRKEELEREHKEQEKKELEKRETDKKAKDKQRLAEARERQAREAEALKAQADRERALQQRASADAARVKADRDYVNRVQAKIRGNVVLPSDIGNPEAVFEVVQLPTGEILDAQLRKSSGVRAYDEAVQRAILKSSPLPQPENPELFRRTLTLKFRPLD